MSGLRTLATVIAVCSLLLAGCSGSPGSGTPTATGDGTSTATGAGATTATTDAPTPQSGSGVENESRPRVVLRDANGTRLGTVTVTISDNGSERETGLSETQQLNDSEGMLFVYESPGTYTYVMRDMDFPLDIIFVAPNGTVTTIHHAPTEPGESGSELTHYPGTGQYVLEVNRGYANRTGLSVGDTVAIPAGIATSDATPNPDGQ